jgi:hypothetical protein
MSIATSLKQWFDRMRRRFYGRFGGTVTPTPTPTPSPAAPVNSSLPVITGSAVKGQMLAVSTGAWLNSTTGFAYDWKRGGVSIGATASTYVLVAGDIGSIMTCTVTASNVAGSTAATSAGTSAVIDLVPVNTVLPAITGTPTEGQTLTVSNGTWINTPISYARQWLRNGSAIGGATGATYLLVTADLGGNISCTVTATNSGGSTPATSASVGPVGGATAAPVNTVLPVLTGDAVVGQTLFSGNGSWDITPTSFTYQWYDASGAITGETADNYTVQDSDVGKLIHCAVTAYNIAAASLPASSAATPAVTDISLTNAITALSRTSSSGVTPMTWSVTFGSNVYEGYTLRAKVYSDSGLSTLVQDVAHVLTGPDMVASATIDLASDGLTAPGATDWLQLGIEATSPHGIPYSYTYGTPISPTDAAVAMTLSASDKAAGISLSNGNLFAAQGSAPGGGRASRGVSSGKFYVEWVAATAQINLYDSSASLTVDQEAAANGGTPSAHAAVYSSNNGTINYNATSATVTTFGGAVFIAGISGTVMTVSNAIIGTLAVGQYIAGPGITWGTKITSLGTGGGGNGTYNINISQTVVDDGTVQVSGPLIGMAVDATADKIAWALNNSWQNSANPSAGTGMLSISGISKPVFPAYNITSNGYRLGFFPGTTPGTTTGFVFTPPTGYLAP